jgi:hypothetical protein
MASCQRRRLYYCAIVERWFVLPGRTQCRNWPGSVLASSAGAQGPGRTLAVGEGSSVQALGGGSSRPLCVSIGVMMVACGVVVVQHLSLPVFRCSMYPRTIEPFIHSACYCGSLTLQSSQCFLIAVSVCSLICLVVGLALPVAFGIAGCWSGVLVAAARCRRAAHIRPVSPMGVSDRCHSQLSRESSQLPVWYAQPP